MWQAAFFSALAPVRTLALAMMTAHLGTGHDVVFPQLVTNPDEAEQVQDVARSAQADYVEVVLIADVEDQIRRFRGDSRGAVRRQIAQAVDALGGDGLLRKIDDDFAGYLAHRPQALRIDTSSSSVDDAYARLLSLLDVRPP